MFILFILSLFSTSTLAIEKLTDFNCEKLIEKSADKKFPLAVLAGLRAHQKCPNFKYEWRNITDIEKRIFSDELIKIDPLSIQPLTELSIEELKLKLKNEKNNVEKLKFFKLLRQKYKNAGRRDDGKKLIQNTYIWSQKKWKTNPKDAINKSQYFEMSLIQAKTLWNSGQIKIAKDLLIQLNSELKSENLAESYYLLGKMAEDTGELNAAINNYDLSLKALKKDGIPANSNLDLNKLAWTKSWLLYKSEKWIEAEISLREFSESTTDLTEKTRADFFRSRVLVKINKLEESKLVLRNIVDKDIYSYYSLASYHLLNENLPAVSKIKKTNAFVFDQNLSFLSENFKTVFDELIKHDELDIAEKSVAVFSKNNDQNVNVSLYLAAKAGRYLPLFSSFAKLSNDAKMDVMQQYPNLIFPKPHESDVRKVSAQTELPKSLIYSIMKQESGFNLKTRSHADAYGLMQLIPKLAKTLAKKYEIPYSEPDDLYKPEINIPLGAFELRDQIKKQNGQLTFVAAAYNAGPGALSGWLKLKKTTEDVFDFIESIPYDETRMYVKIIARNKLFYDRFEKPDQSFPFPAEFVTESQASVSK